MIENLNPRKNEIPGQEAEELEEEQNWPDKEQAEEVDASYGKDENEDRAEPEIIIEDEEGFSGE